MDEKSKKILYRFLKEKKLLYGFGVAILERRRRYSDYNATIKSILEEYTSNPQHAIDNLMTWAKTKEGWDVWNNANKEFISYFAKQSQLRKK